MEPYFIIINEERGCIWERIYQTESEAQAVLNSLKEKHKGTHGWEIQKRMRRASPLSPAEQTFQSI